MRRHFDTLSAFRPSAGSSLSRKRVYQLSVPSTVAACDSIQIARLRFLHRGLSLNFGVLQRSKLVEVRKTQNKTINTFTLDLRTTIIRTAVHKQRQPAKLRGKPEIARYRLRQPSTNQNRCMYASQASHLPIIPQMGEITPLTYIPHRTRTRTYKNAQHTAAHATIDVRSRHSN